MKTVYDVPVVIRREIEAQIIKPLIDEVEKEIGREKALEMLERVIREIAREQGAQYAKKIGANDLCALLKQEEAWTANDALELSNILLDDGSVLQQTITKCAYVEMYRRLGLEALGYTLSCMRDESFYAGFNPKIKMMRSKTLMTGGDCCDFCFNLQKKE